MVAGFVFCFTGITGQTVELSKCNKLSSDLHYFYSPIKDTLHLLGDVYISISLNDQIATVIRRNDTTVSFPISSGNANISKGINTPTGLYTVQSKSTKALSKQFDNAELLNWVGFNGNIGFHGLSGSGYYNHLGKRPSSHGCVRISREDGERLFKKVKLGTPVLVFQEEPAIVMQFDSLHSFNPRIDYLLQKKDKSTELMFNYRISSLYEGEFFKNIESKLFLDGKSVIKNRGFRIGDAKKIASKQNPILVSSHIKPTLRDATRSNIFYELLKNETMTRTDSLSKKSDRKTV